MAIEKEDLWVQNNCYWINQLFGGDSGKNIEWKERYWESFIWISYCESLRYSNTEHTSTPWISYILSFVIELLWFFFFKRLFSVYNMICLKKTEIFFTS